MSKEIITMGSINQDIFVNADQYPKLGDTVWVKSVNNQPGGKGANQAISLSKIGNEVRFIGAVGQDNQGQNMLDNLKKYGVNTEYISIKDDINTGTFIVILDGNGENTMLGTLGANNYLTELEIKNAFENTDAQYFLLQLETNKDAIEKSIEIAKQKDIKIILDPAPADGYDEKFLKHAFIVTPNQQEAQVISGVEVNDRESAEKAAKIIKTKGAENVIVKMGDKGSLILNNDKTTFVPAYQVDAVNTVGAGDVFAAAMTVYLNDSLNIEEAVKFASAASAIKVSKEETQEAIPSYSEIIEFMKNN
ncbi:ribokinase [Staphylococcus sciuri]|uniref:ribokinase n=1 Tax=Mammaliicoccus sciuri TaxID=1296 RepID=UPI000D1D9F15|nr:ribokinase [Mammaliicoccus sciuri]HCW34781.1 ribokinase [Staphylococcus sp.]MCJ0909849.1 ribokinase [Mammaliicoccus sciuri]MDO0950841.1 ribokinase [Mammaliicoccus sciuri]NGX75742.1 ribokinase [Mammaliicoccus sciuri]PTJ54427.1 ribokinase [Mammaliicoccus sciuri]